MQKIKKLDKGKIKLIRVRLLHADMASLFRDSINIANNALPSF